MYSPFVLLLLSVSLLESKSDRLEEFVSLAMQAKSDEEQSILIEKYQDLPVEEIRKAFDNRITEFRNKSDYKNALAVSILLLKISELRGDYEGKVSAIYAKGTVQQLQDNKEEAFQTFSESLKLSESIGYKKGIADSLESIAMLKKDWVQYDAAMRDLNRSLEIYRSIDDKRGISNALSTIGDVYEDQSIHEEALKFYEQSLKLREELGDPIEIGKSYVRIGNAVGPMGKEDLALKYYQDAVRLFQEGNSPGRAAAVYNNMANVVANRGNWGLGLQYYLKALKFHQEAGSKQAMAYPTLNIGVFHEAHGNYELAMDYYKTARELFEESGMKGLAIIASSNIAGIYALLGQHDEALKQYKEILKLQTQMKVDSAGIFGAMAAVYELKGDHNTALQFCLKSLDQYKILADKNRIMELTLMSSRLYRTLRQYQEALDSAKTAVALAIETDIPEILWAARLEEGRAYQALGEREKARSDFEEAVRLVEFLRTQVTATEWETQQYFQSRTEPYYEMIQSLASENRITEALNYSELSKSRVLLDVLASGKINITKDMTPEEKEKEQSLKSTLASLNTQLLASRKDQKKKSELENNLKKVRLDLESFYTNLYAAHPDLDIHRGKLVPAGLNEASKVLDQKSVLLEYVVAETQTILFVITNDHSGNAVVHMHRMKLDKEYLGNTVRKFREQLAEQDPGFRTLAKELYRILIKPADSEISGKESIIIVPDRDLWELPFQALQNSRNEYLLQMSAVSYAPSLTVLSEMINSQQNRNSSTTLLAFANPQIAAETTDRVKTLASGENLYPLSEAEKGVKSLSNLYGTENTRIFTGGDATEETFKKQAQAFDVIHVAAHGIISDTDPMYSHLVLAKEKDSVTEDGLLEPWEVLDLNLNASLIVLSACETARGRVSTGEGMIGFTWAFFVAGTPSTIVSQWKVDAISTTQLMNEFHLNWHGGPMDGISKTESLRKSALKLMESAQFSHPFSWAGFVLIGDPW